MKLNRLQIPALLIALGSLLSQPHLTAADLEADAFP